MTKQAIQGFPLWLSVLVITLACPPAPAATRHVPSQYATIQRALNAAVDGDVVLIANGTYTGAFNWDLDFGGKAITVRSASGNPALCIIDCQASGRGFWFHTGEGPDSVVEGLTIKNGYESNGGGIQCVGSSPTIFNCMIESNRAYTSDSGGGGGIHCSSGGNPVISHCTINHNHGGGVACSYSSPTLLSCALSSNKGAYGGGVWCSHGSPTLSNCMIAANRVSGSGGGMACGGGSSPTLTNCVITGNVAREARGGAIDCQTSSNPRLTNCTLTGNKGGGIYCLNVTLHPSARIFEIFAV